MSRSLLPVVALLTGLVTSTQPSPVAAQQAEIGSGAVTLVRPAPPPPSTSHRILTLAWTEITIPASLARAAVSVTPRSEPRYFILTWQPRAEDGPPVVGVVTQQCATMTLVVMACEAR